jgi:hypothetical protein
VHPSGKPRTFERSLRLTACVTLALLAPLVGSARADEPLSISISGNHFVNAVGQTVQLVGVNRMSSEYACTYGYVASGPGVSPDDPSGTDPLDGEDAAAIASWHANAVRIPLNEDCWLGERGEPADGLTAAAYRQAIQGYVQDLAADGIYSILDLHWTDPDDLESEGQPEDGQHAMPDAHSLTFWESVSSAFKSDPAVLFDAFNEPFSPEANGNSSEAVSWSCWEDGGCQVPGSTDLTTPNPAVSYTAVGMQQLVDAIRSTGAIQPILLGALSYANDLSQWLAYEPSDPDHQLAASFHNYTGESCDTETCWNETIAPVASQVPVVTGEFDEDDCPPSGADASDFDNAYMSWADAHGVSYLAWGWVVLEAPQPCSALYLITDYSGTPAEPNGVALRDHLAALALARAPETTQPIVSEPPPASPVRALSPTTSSAPPSRSQPSAAASGASATPAALAAARRVSATLKWDLSQLQRLSATALLAVHGRRLRLRAPQAGVLSLQLLSGGTAARRALLLASANVRTEIAGLDAMTVHLSAAGRRLLSRHKHPPSLIARVSFAVAGRPAQQVEGPVAANY